MDKQQPRQQSKQLDPPPVWDLDFLQEWTVPAWQLDTLSEWEASMEDIQTQWNDFAAAYSDPAQSPVKQRQGREKVERK